jgi:hypothetical protein
MDGAPYKVARNIRCAFTDIYFLLGFGSDIEMSEYSLIWLGLAWISLDWVGMDWIREDWLVLAWIVLDRLRLAKIGSVWLGKFPLGLIVGRHGLVEIDFSSSSYTSSDMISSHFVHMS